MQLFTPFVKTTAFKLAVNTESTLTPQEPDEEQTP